MKTIVTKVALVITLLIGVSQQAHALDLIVFIPSFIAGKDPFTFTLLASDFTTKTGYPVEAIIGALLFPFAVLDEANNTVTVQDASLIEAGYDTQQIADYKSDLSKIGSALNGKTVTRQQFKSFLVQIPLSQTTREILQLK